VIDTLRPMSAGTRRSVWLAAAAVAGCQGRGIEALEQSAKGLNEALETLAIVMMVIAALGLVVYALLWWSFVATLRAGGRPRVSSAALVFVHGCALLAAGEDTGEPMLMILRISAVLPALALALGWSERVWIRGLVFAAAMAGMLLLPAHRAPLTRLPAPIVAVSSAFQHACALLADGRVACAGSSGAASGGPKFDWQPALVEGVEDAAEIHTASGLSCALRRGGGAVCWSGADWQRAPFKTPGARPLPGGEAATDLVMNGAGVLTRTGDRLSMWPHALPAGLTEARAIAANGAIDEWFAAIDLEGVVWTWKFTDGVPAEVVRIRDAPGATQVAIQDEGAVCLLVDGGAVDCREPPDDGQPGKAVRVPEVVAAEVVAIDDAFDSFCARAANGTVRCWSEHQELNVHANLPRVEGRLSATSSALCDTKPRVRCVTTSFDLDDSLAELLRMPVER
jgi:hypothetical protein